MMAVLQHLLHPSSKATLTERWLRYYWSIVAVIDYRDRCDKKSISTIKHARRGQKPFNALSRSLPHRKLVHCLGWQRSEVIICVVNHGVLFSSVKIRVPISIKKIYRVITFAIMGQNTGRYKLPAIEWVSGAGTRLKLLVELLLEPSRTMSCSS